MTLVQLQYIVMVDTYQSFVAAAKHCNVSQPTLTMQVQKLEKELGHDLFDRTSLPIQTFPEAQAVLDRARSILKQSHEIYSLMNVDQSNRNSLLGKRAKNSTTVV